MTPIKLFCTILFLLAAHAGHASIESLPCNACDDQQKQALARDQGVGTHYIHDFESGLLSRFRVHSAAQSKPGPTATLVSPQPVAQQYQDYFSSLVQVRQAVSSAPRRATLPAELSGDQTTADGAPLGSVSAYDVVSASFARNRLADHIVRSWNELLQATDQSPAASEGLLHLLQSRHKVHMEDATIVVRVPVTLADGSRVVFETTTVSEAEPAYVPGSAVDANGNDVPDSVTQVAPNIYSFAQYPEQLRAWVKLVEMYGATVNLPEHSPLPTEWTCRKAPDGAVCDPRG